MCKNAEKSGLLPAVNFHLWQPCNMRCSFCFATFLDVKQSCLPKGHLPAPEAVRVVEALCHAGTGKITFAGGEPTLCPWLPDLLEVAKRHGVTTMLVTNGTRLEENWIQKHSFLIDWITLSVDSLDPIVNAQSGRKVPGCKAPNIDWYLDKVRIIKDAGIRFKTNTVVYRLNVEEDMSNFISTTQPERWKLFQVLPVKGQNDHNVDDFLISKAEFDSFFERHKLLLPDQHIVPESNDLMTGSYLMVDPAGRFFDNVDGKHTYSQPILEVGVSAAVNDIRFDLTKFYQRDGIYDWGNSGLIS
ncbi:MAG TPA: radical SAM protein [Chitinophagaceae bacterium]|nr:radical SAM protein [Chitinophagaceae bacterium]